MLPSVRWLMLAVLAAAVVKAEAGYLDDVALLCVVSLSYNRPHYLIPSIREFIKYARRVEPDLAYVIQILDNGSGQQELQEIQEGLAALRAPNMQLVHLNKTAGLARGFNLLFHDMCGSYKFVLSLEDDWQARTDWPASLPALQTSMQLLESDSNLLEVWLRDFGVTKGIHAYAGWQPATVDVQGKQISLNLNHMSCPFGSTWGVYTNGASMKHMGRLRQIGRQPTEHGDGRDGERAFSETVCNSQFHAALVCAGPGSNCLKTGWFEDTYTSLFEHIGRKRVSVQQDSRFSEVLDLAHETVGDETLLDIPHVELPVAYVCHSVGRLVQCNTVAWTDTGFNSYDLIQKSLAQPLHLITSAMSITAQDCSAVWTAFWVILAVAAVVAGYAIRRTTRARAKGRQVVLSPLLK